MDDRLTPAEKVLILEDALRSYPLAEMPRDISVDVLARIKRAPEPFKFISWRDVAPALAISLCVGILIFSAQNFPPILLARLRVQEILMYQNFIVATRGFSMPAALLAFSASLSLLAIPYARGRAL